MSSIAYDNGFPWLRAAVAAALLSLTSGCVVAAPGGTRTGPGRGSTGDPAAPGAGDRPARGAPSRIDPYTCGNYAVSDFGRRLQAFLVATNQLHAAVESTERDLRQACTAMGGHLGVATAQLGGDTRALCAAVAHRLRADLDAGLQPRAELDLRYQPAVCTVNADVAADAAAECTARARTDVEVYCRGTCHGTCTGGCSGTCQGRCHGACQGTTSADGTCSGVCEGTCEGTCHGTCDAGCTGRCDGHADVQAEAACEARAEIEANVQAECTEPALDIHFDPALVGDQRRLEAALRAIREGLPTVLRIHAAITGPVRAAFQTWSRATTDMVAAGPEVLASIGEQSLCVFGQLQAAAALLTSIQVSIDVQVEVSAEIQATAGG